MTAERSLIPAPGHRRDRSGGSPVRCLLVTVIAAATWVGVTLPPSLQASMLCKMPSGTIALRDACSSDETPLDAGMVKQALQCPPDAVKVGPTCVDIYEASIWQIPPDNTALIDKVLLGEATLADLTAAGAVQYNRSDPWLCYYPLLGTFPWTGNWSEKFFAVSIPGVKPAGCVSWFQAEQACAVSGKRLLTNQEWQRAAAGTPDGPPCIVQPVSKGITGDPSGGTTGTSGCHSKWGTYDMVGNVREWVADWVDAAESCTNWPADFGSDVSCVGGPGGPLWYSLPHPYLRGGSYLDGPDAGVFAITAKVPATEAADGTIGFRCGR